MALDFPSNPTVNDIYSYGGYKWICIQGGATPKWQAITSSLQGTTGTQGIQGNQGTIGIQGFTGIQGFYGIQGIQGNQGTTGTQGQTGTQGATGTQGFVGNQGIQGNQGTTGLQGTTGTQGLTGNQGTIGTQGLQGIQGIQGLLGNQGVINTFATSATTPPSSPQQGQVWLDSNTGQYYLYYQTAWIEIAQSQVMAGPQGVQGSQGFGFAQLQGTTGPTGPMLTYSINNQTGTSYNPALSDASAVIIMNNGSANTVSIQTDAVTNFSTGSVLTIFQQGAGQTTVNAVTPATTTIYSVGTTSTAPKLRSTYSSCTAVKISANTWFVVGDIV